MFQVHAIQYSLFWSHNLQCSPCTLKTFQLNCFHPKIAFENNAFQKYSLNTIQAWMVEESFISGPGRVWFISHAFTLFSKLILHILPGLLHSQPRFIFIKRILSANRILLRDVSTSYISLEHWQFISSFPRQIYIT